MSLDPALGIWRTCDGCGKRFWCEDGTYYCDHCEPPEPCEVCGEPVHPIYPALFERLDGRVLCQSCFENEAEVEDDGR